MTNVTFTPHRSALGVLIKKPGGTTAGKALVEVAQRLDAIRAESRAEMSQRINTLEQLVMATEPDLAAWLSKIEALSSELITVAALFDMTDMARAADGLCGLAERFTAAGEASLPALQVHVRAIRLLFAEPPLPEAARAEVLHGLERVVDGVPRR